MSVLFEPIAIGSTGSMFVKNRFVRSATHDFMGNRDGTISDRELDLYKMLAANDVGLIITGQAYVQHPVGRATAGQNAIYDDSFIAGYRQLADIVHEHGAKLVLQVSHAGRQSVSALKDGVSPVAPSAVTDTSTGITPRALVEDEIWQWVDAFAAAMARAKSAGCDGVQLHIAHGYGLSQFISPYTNRRQDGWGGSVENRTRILREIMVRGRQLVGDEFPVLVKLNSTDGFDGPGYLSLEDVVYTAKLLDRLGVSAIEVSGGINESQQVTLPPSVARPEQEAGFSAAAKAVKAAVSVPVILVGGLRSLSVMESVVNSGICDLVALSRPLIEEPDLVVRFRNGQSKASCISCNACFNPRGIACRRKVSADKM